MRVAAIVAVFALSLGVAQASDAFGNTLVTHEWGTFTSVAGDTGSPVPWAPLFGPADLPCFVLRGGTGNLPKRLVTGLVRMETPVLYFYSQHPVTASVHVDFPKGSITEWYPDARVTSKGASSNGTADWDAVHILPGQKLEFPTSTGASHYYAARNTDAAPLRIGDQQEKMIFYRGVGNFLPPLWPKYTFNGKLEIRNTGADPIPAAIVFENHGDKLGYRIVRAITDSVTVDPPELTGDIQQLRQRLAIELEEFGLYRKEAQAMVETWRDSWFEEGTRVFYILPTAQVNPLLPLTITPAPAEIARVFVGRVEVLSPWTRQAIESAMSNGDVATLTKFGRFLDPFLAQSRLKNPNGAAAQRTNAYLANAQSEVARTAGSCVQ